MWGLLRGLGAETPASGGNWGFGASPLSAGAWRSGGKAPATGGIGPGQKPPALKEIFLQK